MVFMTDQKILTEKDLDYIESRLKDVFATKEDFEQYRSQIMDKLDSILKEILTSREEQTVLGHQVSGHEDRITKLEHKQALA